MNKLKLFAATLLLGIGGNAAAQTDVTATYIQNPGFETSPIFDGTSLGAEKTANATATEGSTLLNSNPNVFNISGWTTFTTEAVDFARTFTMPYNTNLYVQGNNATGGQLVSSPDNGSSVATDNNTLLFVEANWCPGALLGVKQEATLPVGVYKLTFDTYVSNTLANAKSLCGVKFGTQAVYKWPSQLNTWTENEIYFSLDAETTVEFSMGYAKIANVGGGSSAFMFADNLKLIKLTDKAFVEKDVTENITNPNADTNTSGWTMSYGGRNGGKGFDGKAGFFEPSNWGASSWDVNMVQTITDLPNGIYKVQAAVQSASGVMTWITAGNNESQILPATGTADGTIAADGSVVEAGAGVAGWHYGSSSVLVTDGNLTIGGRSKANAVHLWTNLDNFTLTYLDGSKIIADQIELKKLLAEAQQMIDGGNYKGTEELQATVNVTSDKQNSFDETEVSNAITSLSAAIKNVKISNASMVNPYVMTVENGDMATNSGWTGSDKFSYVTDNENPGSNVTRPYYETWVSAPGTQKTERQFYQTLANCPQGAYELKAAVTATYQMANVNVNENTGVYLYVKDGENITKTYCKSGDNAQYFSVIINHETNGDLEVGLVMEGETRVNWVAFDNFSLTCYGIGNYEALAQRNYENVKAAAETTTNENVTGYEAQELAAAIAVEPTTTEEYIAAANDLQVKTINFNRAEPTYNSYADWKTTAKNTTLAYASTTSKDNLTTAINTPATVNSAADAKTAEDNIVAKLRAYYESNGMAEGIEGAINCTDKVVNADFSTPIEDPKAENRNKISGWTSTQGGGSLNIMSNETWTNADGSLGGNYYDYYNSSANNQHAYQTVENLEPGKYIVTIKARAQSGFWLYLIINDNQKVNIKEIGNTGGVFNRGWNDCTAEFTVDKAGSVKIEVANTPDKNMGGWFGFGDVRLVKIGDLDEVILDENETNIIEDGKLAKITLNRTIAEGKWNTLVLPFDLTNDEVKAAFGEKAQVAAFSNIDGANVEFNTTGEGVKANVPVLIKAAAGNEFTFNGYTLAAAADVPTATGAEYNFVGCYEPTMLEDGDYLLKTDQWWKKEATDSYGVKGFRAFLRANNPETAAKTLSLVIDGETTGVKLNTVTGEIEGETYNISGQKVTDSYKGIVIKNGKKVVRK